jgi:G3E family GTPase
MSRIPVTILTGFLGSGKTTLLNRILTEQHGLRIAVIENEFGEIGIDQGLVINADEEIFEMNNGCICCTVRGDLIRILGSLLKRRERFDYVLVETTGLADPGPVAQTFFVDEELRDEYMLDGIVTLVDSHHIEQHLDGSQECQEQVAFADVILLNKTDLVGPGSLTRLEHRIQKMNGSAKVLRCQNAQVDLDQVINLGAFDLDSTLGRNPTFLDIERPFEWSGCFQLQEGSHRLTFQPGPDPEMLIAVLPLLGGEGALDPAYLAGQAETVYDGEAIDVAAGQSFAPACELYRLSLAEDQPTIFELPVAAAGEFHIFTQHRPEEFALTFANPSGALVSPTKEQEWKSQHEHEDDVGSVGIEMPGAVEQDAFNFWLSGLLRERGPDLFRMKGFLNVKDQPNRFVFQGVHMLFDCDSGEPWNDEPKVNRLVFIGRNLNREELVGGFTSCLK